MTEELYRSKEAIYSCVCNFTGELCEKRCRACGKVPEIFVVEHTRGPHLCAIDDQVLADSYADAVRRSLLGRSEATRVLLTSTAYKYSDLMSVGQQRAIADKAGADTGIVTNMRTGSKRQGGKSQKRSSTGGGSW